MATFVSASSCACACAHTFRTAVQSTSRPYTCAITRGIPDTFGDALSSQSEAVTISVSKAKEEHANYVSFMRSILPTVHLPASDDHPDCPFVEDSAVVVGNKAVVTRIGAPSRRGEEVAIRTALTQLGLEVVDMTQVSGQAAVDGGDVLHPVTSSAATVSVGVGRSPTVSNGKGHMFVGISGRTNMEGAKVLDRVFGGSSSGIEVVPVPIPTIEESGALHLKSIVTHVDEKTLLAPKGELGDQVLNAMRAEDRGYTAIRLPDIAACNAVVVNGVVMATPTDCVESKEIFQREIEKRGLSIRYITNVEYAKCDGAMTCRSILLDI